VLYLSILLLLYRHDCNFKCNFVHYISKNTAVGPKYGVRVVDIRREEKKHPLGYIGVTSLAVGVLLQLECER